TLSGRLLAAQVNVPNAKPRGRGRPRRKEDKNPPAAEQKVSASHLPTKKNPRKRARSPSPAAKPASAKRAAVATARAARPAVPIARRPRRGDVINTAPNVRLTIYAFGDNQNGELGLGPRPAAAAPAGSDEDDDDDEEEFDSDVKVPTKNLVRGAVQVAVGGMHCAALTDENKILTWGVNDVGALGRDTTHEGRLVDADASGDDEQDDEDNVNPKESTPGEVDLGGVPAGTVFTQVAASDNATFALTELGDVYGWGTFRSNDGVNSFLPRIAIQTTPRLIPGLKHIIKLAAGTNHVLALAADLRVYAWGSGAQGQLGRKLPLRRLIEAGLTPARLGIKNIVEIGVGSDHAFAIRSDGQVYAWGLNNFGQTGIPAGAGGDDACIFTCTLAPNLAPNQLGGTVTCVAGGNHHSLCVTREDGECYAWGRYDGGATGVATLRLRDDNEGVVLDERNRPRILSVPKWVGSDGMLGREGLMVAAGAEHSVFVALDGDVWAWGYNSNHQTAVVEDTPNDQVQEPRQIEGVMEGREIVWAGCGGQFTLL
ncbi:regulator of chromosome condensation 1/beta-lactamase-inhibitor protein II, partial [Podospora appendiculata]